METIENISAKLLKEQDNLYTKFSELKKTDSEEKDTIKKLQNKIAKEIELKKILSKIKILTIVIEELNTVSSLYEIGYNEKKINDKVITQIEDEYKKLDVLSTKAVLAKEFGVERQKGIRKYDFGTLPLFGGVSFSLIVGIPLFKLVNLPYSLINICLPFIIPSIIGYIGTCHFMKKHTNKKIEIFSNINNQLGDDKLSLESDGIYKEQLFLERLVNKKIYSIATMILMNIREFQYLIENSNEDNNKQVLNISNKEYNDVNNKQVSINDLNYDNEIKEKYPITIKKVLVLKRK